MWFIKLSACVLVYGLIENNIVRAESNCNDSESPLSCHGTRIARNIMQQLVSDTSASTFKIVPGLELVELKDVKPETLDENGRSNSVDGSDESFVNRVSRYLQTHELKIKFSDLVERGEFKDVIKTALSSIDEGKGIVEGRKKDKSGLGGALLMGMMMAKMMAALGMAGIAALAAKALGVALMALLLSAIIGIKKLAESGHDDGGHHVQYIHAGGEHGHRRRRDIMAEDSIPLPYKGWAHYAN